MHIPSLKRWIENVSSSANPARDSRKPSEPSCTEVTSSTQENGSQTDGRQELPLGNGQDPHSEETGGVTDPTATIPVHMEDRPSGGGSKGHPDAMAHSQDGDPLIIKFSNKGITCEHGKLCPHQTRNSKIISTVSDFVF